MCNLYSIKTRRADLARKFRLSDNRMAAFEPLPAIFPGHMAPIPLLVQLQTPAVEFDLVNPALALGRRRAQARKPDRVQSAVRVFGLMPEDLEAAGCEQRTVFFPLDDARHIRLPVMHHSQNGKCRSERDQARSVLKISSWLASGRRRTAQFDRG
jgi:hypothetical protein